MQLSLKKLEEPQTAVLPLLGLIGVALCFALIGMGLISVGVMNVLG